MKRVLKIALATAAIGLTSMPTAANAALTVEGVTYDLILNSVVGNTGNFDYWTSLFGGFLNPKPATP